MSLNHIFISEVLQICFTSNLTRHEILDWRKKVINRKTECGTKREVRLSHGKGFHSHTRSLRAFNSCRAAHRQSFFHRNKEKNEKRNSTKPGREKWGRAKRRREAWLWPFKALKSPFIRSLKRLSIAKDLWELSMLWENTREQGNHKKNNIQKGKQKTIFGTKTRKRDFAACLWYEVLIDDRRQILFCFNKLFTLLCSRTNTRYFVH